MSDYLKNAKSFGAILAGIKFVVPYEPFKISDTSEMIWNPLFLFKTVISFL